MAAQVMESVEELASFGLEKGPLIMISVALRTT
jgi:hypothetical protein